MTQESIGVSPDVEELLATAPPGETPDLSGAFPRLSEERIRMLCDYGSRRPTSLGELLIVEGRPDEAFIVVLSGRVAIVKAFGTPEQQIVRVPGPGRFLGELGLLTGQVAFFTAIVLDPGEVLEVPTDRLRECLCGIPRSAT
jgi:thioredoxin reductase (NADPH)